MNGDSVCCGDGKEMLLVMMDTGDEGGNDDEPNRRCSVVYSAGRDTLEAASVPSHHCL